MEEETNLELEGFITEVSFTKSQDFNLEEDERRRERMAEVIRKRCKIPVMDLSMIGIGPKSDAVACAFVASNEDYTTLILSGNNFGDNGVAPICELISKTESLTSLDLSGCEICSRGLEKLFEAMHLNKTLTSLNISAISGGARNRLGTKGTLALAKFLASESNKVLTGLEMADCSPNETNLAALIDSLRHTELVHINISSDGVTDPALEPMLSFQDTLPIETLNMSGNWIGSKGASAISKLIGCCPQLRDLDLSRNRIGAVGANHLSVALHGSKSLVSLRLDSNGIGTAGFQSISEIYGQLSTATIDSKKLTQLVLNDSRDPTTKLPDQVIQQQQILQRVLRVLTLSDNNLDGQSGEILSAFIGKAPMLEKLDLSRNNLNDVGIISLSTALAKDSCSLKNLDISANRFGDAACIELAKSLALNKSLKRLDISHNRGVGNSGCDAISRSLDTNTKLEFVCIDYTMVGYRSHDALVARLRHNRNLQAGRAVQNVEMSMRKLQGANEWIGGLQERSENAKRELELVQRKLEEVRIQLSQEQGNATEIQTTFNSLLTTRAEKIQQIILAEAKAREEIERAKSEREVALKNMLIQMHREKDLIAMAAKRVADAEKKLATFTHESGLAISKLEHERLLLIAEKRQLQVSVQSMRNEMQQKKRNTTKERNNVPSPPTTKTTTTTTTVVPHIETKQPEDRCRSAKSSPKPATPKKSAQKEEVQQHIQVPIQQVLINTNSTIPTK